MRRRLLSLALFLLLPLAASAEDRAPPPSEVLVRHARSLRRLRVWTAAYGTASLVAFSRVYHDAHWTSDVLAGAFIGTAVGWSVVRLNRGEARRERSTSVSLTPVIGLRAWGLNVSVTSP